MFKFGFLCQTIHQTGSGLTFPIFKLKLAEWPKQSGISESNIIVHVCSDNMHRKMCKTLNLEPSQADNKQPCSLLHAQNNNACMQNHWNYFLTHPIYVLLIRTPESEVKHLTVWTLCLLDYWNHISHCRQTLSLHIHTQP